MEWQHSYRFDPVAAKLADRHYNPKKDPGYCYLCAGFEPVGETKGGLKAFQLVPEKMPWPEAAGDR